MPDWVIRISLANCRKGQEKEGKGQKNERATGKRIAVKRGNI